ncbi:MAG: DUF3078 domain-containing protein [Paludibacteraceae bacterium]|nr:DUF3078 domain-containing protein [Paludibacteraceae bacterium]
MKQKILLFSLLIIPFFAFGQAVDKTLVETKAQEAKKAQDELKKVDTGEQAWKLSGVLGLNGSATGLVNWAAGGKNNAAGLAFVKLRLLYHENNMAWDTNLDLEYGMTYMKQDEDPLQKTSDKIKFATKFGWEFSPQWYLTILGGFQSQFAPGYNYAAGYNDIISKWLAPSYTDISVGIDWKPNDIFSVYLSPIAGRITTAYTSDAMNNRMNNKIVEAWNKGEIDAESDWWKNNGKFFTEKDADGNYYQGYRSLLQDKYGVYRYTKDENGDWELTPANARAELGLSFKGQINYKYKDLTILTTLGLFTPYQWYQNTDEDGKKYFIDSRHFGRFDMDWDFAISYQFLKCLNVTFTTSTRFYNGVKIADKDGVEAERVQFMGVLGIGVGYSF